MQKAVCEIRGWAFTAENEKTAFGQCIKPYSNECGFFAENVDIQKNPDYNIVINLSGGTIYVKVTRHSD